MQSQRVLPGGENIGTCLNTRCESKSVVSLLTYLLTRKGERVLTSPHLARTPREHTVSMRGAAALWLSTSPVAALLLSPVRISRAPVAAADARRCDVVAKYFAPLETPAAYEELLAGARNESISVIKFASAHCRTCRAAEPKLEAFAKRWPGASFHSLVLKKDGKMAGTRRASNPPTLGGPGPPSQAGPP